MDDLDYRLKAALRSLADAVPVDVGAGLAPVVERPRPHHRPMVPLGSLAVICVLLATIVLVANRASLTPSPVAQTPSPAATTAISTEDASPTVAATGESARYSDGIPRFFEGRPVLRGQAALERASASVDSTPFLIALWAGYEYTHSCGAGNGQNALYSCGQLNNVGDQPGLSSALGKVLRIDPGVDLSAHVPGPVILRVHTHDRTLMNCPPSTATACDHVMIGDEVVWSGDTSTSPRPASLSDVGAAFSVPPTPSRFVDCMSVGFTGAPVLTFPPTSDPAQIKGVVIVFPSPSSLAAVAADAAASGESDAPLTGHQVCSSIHWLARGNVLVGVRYPYAGPDFDPYLASARAALATLPER